MFHRIGGRVARGGGVDRLREDKLESPGADVDFPDFKRHLARILDPKNRAPVGLRAAARVGDPAHVKTSLRVEREDQRADHPFPPEGKARALDFAVHLLDLRPDDRAAVHHLREEELP